MTAPLPRGGRHQYGLTILETLVTLVIASGVVTTGFMMLTQLTRAEHLLTDTRLRSAQEAVQKEWLRELLSGLIPDHAGRAGEFRGSPNRIAGLSTALIQATGGLGRFELDLEFNSNTGATEFRYRESPGGAAVVLLTVPGPQVSFKYLDTTGRVATHWPPAMSNGPQLPRAIIVSAAQRSVALIAVPHASPIPPLRRADLLNL